MECCRAEQRLAARQGDGVSLRKHLQRAAAATGKPDPLLLVRWPSVGRPLWWAFNTMARQYGMSGPQPLSCSEIDAWQRLHGIRLTPWELEIIHGFDGVVMEVAARNDQK